MKQDNLRRVSFIIHNQLYVTEIKKLHDELQKIRVSYIFLKGPLMSLYLTGDTPKNPVRDIDILIKRDEYPRIKKMLLGHGYQLSRHPAVLIKRYKGNSPKQQQITFKKRTNNFLYSIDLHQELIAPTMGALEFPLPYKNTQNLTDDAFLHVQKLRFRGNHYPVLKGEFLLFYLCLNSFFQHNCRFTKVSEDISTLLKNKKINWQIVSLFSKKYDVREFIYMPLWMANKMKRKSISSYILSLFQPRSFTFSVALFVLNRPLKQKSSPTEELMFQSRENVILRLLLIDKPILWKILFIFRRASLGLVSKYMQVLFPQNNT